MKRTILLQLFVGWVTMAFAQGSTVCNEDGTVTFKYKNDQAKEVLVDVQFAGRNAMTKDAQGIWTATVGPAAPDMYPYCFIVDGVSVMDPENPQYFPNEGFKNSLLEIPAKTGSLAPRRAVWLTTSRTCPTARWSISTIIRRASAPRIRQWSTCHLSTRRTLRRNTPCSISSAVRQTQRRCIIKWDA